MTSVSHNLPDAPYRKFFGRDQDLINIYENLILGHTYIASIDGVGGIGKSALAHYFCQEVLINQSLYYDSTEKIIKKKNIFFNFSKKEVIEKNIFDYVVWVTAKDTVFDPYAISSQTKKVELHFKGLETLFDALIQVTEMEELYKDKEFEEKKKFFEDIVQTESVLFVLDNLESINDEDFFKYIKTGFNSFANANPKKLKILTTSRKKRRIIDNEICVEGLSLSEALELLKYLATHNPTNKAVNDILNADDGNNVRLVQKMGRIPLMIEFVVGRMCNGKSRGEIDEELRGYPSLEGMHDGHQKRKVMAEIIDFQFKCMYEDLNEKQKEVFKTIAILQKNRHKNSADISFEKLLNITNLIKEELDEVLGSLLDNKLILEDEKRHFTTYPMAINLANQIFDDMDKAEPKIMDAANKLKDVGDKVDAFLNTVKILIDKNAYDEAETKLNRGIELYPDDYRIYHKLAEINAYQSNTSSAHENFKTAANLNPANSKIWYEWIKMYITINQKPTAINLARTAIKETTYDISIINLLMDIYGSLNDAKGWRFLAQETMGVYRKSNENKKNNPELIKLLRQWKNIEYKLYNLQGEKNEYLKVCDELIIAYNDPYLKLELLEEELEVAKKERLHHKIQVIEEKIEYYKQRIDSVPLHVRITNLNKYYTRRDFDNAKNEAYMIIRWTKEPFLNDQQHAWILDGFLILFQVLKKEKDFNQIIKIYEENEAFCKYSDILIKLIDDAKSALEEIGKEIIIDKIGLKIRLSEKNLRKIIMLYFDNDDNLFIRYVRSLQRPLHREMSNDSTIFKWEQTRRNAQGKDTLVIDYSDFWELKFIFNTLIEEYKVKLHPYNSPPKLLECKNKMQKIRHLLDNYIIEARNEFAHTRLQHKSSEEINRIIVDAERVEMFTSEVYEFLASERIPQWKIISSSQS